MNFEITVIAIILSAVIFLMLFVFIALLIQSFVKLHEFDWDTERYSQWIERENIKQKLKDSDW